MLPVVGRRRNVLGGLSRIAVRRGVHEQHVGTHAIPNSVLANLGSALLFTCGALLRLFVQSGSLLSDHRRPTYGR